MFAGQNFDIDIPVLGPIEFKPSTNPVMINHGRAKETRL